MSRRRHNPQQLCPLSSWVGQQWAQILASWFAMGLLQAGGNRIALAAVGSFVWANEFNASKNRVMGGGLGYGASLGGPLCNTSKT
jgi:hypothetical protein